MREFEEQALMAQSVQPEKQRWAVAGRNLSGGGQRQISHAGRI